MSRESLSVRGLCCLMLLLTTFPALPATTTYNFAGHLLSGDASGDFGHNANDTFTGTFTYDTNMPQISIAPGHAVYRQPAPNNIIGISLTIGTTTYSSNPALEMNVSISNDNPAFGGDEFVINTGFGSLIHPLSSSYDFSSMSISFRDSDMTVFSSLAIPPMLPSLGDFETAVLFMDFIQTGPPPDDNMEQLQGIITSLTPVTIPEPSAGLAFLLILAPAIFRKSHHNR